VIPTSPSLVPEAAAPMSKGYGLAREQVIAEQGLAETVFPANCPYRIAQVLDPGLWP
jgi:hypothetical protein